MGGDDTGGDVARGDEATVELEAEGVAVAVAGPTLAIGFNAFVTTQRMIFTIKYKK